MQNTEAADDFDITGYVRRVRIHGNPCFNCFSPAVRGVWVRFYAWDQGLPGMRVGGRRRLLIPYQLAYGETGTGSIPPKADLIFDVELLGILP